MSESKATQPISGRVAEEDFQFLMQHPIAGKVTASEKLRHVVSFYRTYHENLGNYEDCLAELNRLAEPTRRRVKKAESESRVSSELIDKLWNYLPEALAYLATAPLSQDAEKRLPSLLALEDRLCQQTINLLESILRLGLSSVSPTYNPQLLKDKLKIIHELIDLGRQS